MVKGRITNLRSLAKMDETTFLLEATPIRDKVVSFHVKMDTPTNTVNFPLNNGVGSDFMLKRGERLANIKFIEPENVQIFPLIADSASELSVEDLDIGHCSILEKNRLHDVLQNYYQVLDTRTPELSNVAD